MSACWPAITTKPVKNWTNLPERIQADNDTIEKLINVFNGLGKLTEDGATLAAVREKLGNDHVITDELLADFRAALSNLQSENAEWQATLAETLSAAEAELAAIQALDADYGFDARKTLQASLDAFNPTLKAALAALEARHKASLKLLDTAEKALRARQWPGYDGDTARDAKKALLHHDIKKREKPTVRDRVTETAKQASYFINQGHWLLSRFPHGVYADVPGLCKVVSRADIAANDYSLTPGRYVGVALTVEDDDDGEAFRTRMMEIHSELAELNDKAAGLAASIQASFAGLFE